MNELTSINDEYIIDEYKPKIDPTLSEIQECCKLLGINKVSDPDLEYIAIELLRAPMPKGWKFYRNKTNPSSYFFYNPVTKTIQMQHPLYKNYLELYNSEKQKKTDSYNLNSNCESEEVIDNDKEIEKLKQSHAQKINELKKQQKNELDNLIAELDSNNSKKLKKCVSARDKYQLALQKYVDYSQNNRIMMDNQISDAEKEHSQRLAELKKKNEAEIKEIKEKHNKLKKEAETDLKRFQKGIEKKKEEEMKNFEKKLDEDKISLVHKKFKRKFKFFSSKPIFIKPSRQIIKLKKSKPFSLDIVDEEPESESESERVSSKRDQGQSRRSNSDASSAVSKTEIPPFSFNFNQYTPKKSAADKINDNNQNFNNNNNNNGNFNRNSNMNNFENTFIDINIDSDNSSETSSTEVQPLYSPKNKIWLIKESNKIELQMGKTASNLKESLGSTYNAINSEYSVIKETLDKQSMDLNKKSIEYQQKALEINKGLNSAINEIHNMHRMALNTISSLQSSLSPRILYPAFPQTSLTPQPRRSHFMPGTFDSEDEIVNKNKNRIRNRNKNRNKMDEIDDGYEYDYVYEKNKPKKRRPEYEDEYSSLDTSKDFTEFEEPDETDNLKNTTGFRKLKKFTDAFNSAKKAQVKINNNFKRAKQQLYE